MNKHFIFGLGLGYLFTRGGARRNLGGADSTEGDRPPEEEEPPKQGLDPNKEEVVDELIEQVSEDPQAEQEDRRLVEMYRIIRNSATVKWIKKLYNNTCQVCTNKVCGNKRDYSEVAHIRALYTRGSEPGQPSASKLNEIDNLLCLCANCHASFDRCGWHLKEIDGKWKVVSAGNCSWAEEIKGKFLVLNDEHEINPDYVDYHRGDFCEQ